VVVCGAGFGGLWAARTLARSGASADVLLVDRNNYHTFFPLLYQVAAAELTPSDIAYPVRSILRGSGVRFRMGEITSVDVERRVVSVDSVEVPYDKLVLAIGSVPNDFGVPGAADHAFFLRWMHEAIPLRERVLACLERASVERDPEVRRRLLTFLIVGGGPTGVEFAGALAELVRGPVARDFPDISDREPRIVLVEAVDRLLSAMPAHLGAYAAERLRRRGVEVRTGTTVERITATEVRLANGESVPTETAVWTAGIKGDPRVSAWGLPVAPSGRVPVLPTLQVQGRPDVYVVGDLAHLEEDGRPLAQVAQVAIQQGKHAAENIARALRQLPPRPFRYNDLGVMAVIGRNAAVADLRGRTFQGFPAWILWLGIHIAWLIGFRNRALVLVNWAWNYVRFRSAVRLILPTGKRGGAQNVAGDSVGERVPGEAPTRGS
jgi:NADH dehydrogenase